MSVQSDGRILKVTEDSPAPTKEKKEGEAKIEKKLEEDNKHLAEARKATIKEVAKDIKEHSHSAVEKDTEIKSHSSLPKAHEADLGPLNFPEGVALIELETTE